MGHRRASYGMPRAAVGCILERRARAIRHIEPLRHVPSSSRRNATAHCPTPAHRAVTRERSCYSVTILFRRPGGAEPPGIISTPWCSTSYSEAFFSGPLPAHRLVGWWPAHYRQAARSLVPGRSLCSPVLLSPQPAAWPLQQAFGLRQAAAVSRQRPPRCSEFGSSAWMFM